MNKLAQKYKQMRKNGEYAPGNSSESRQKKNPSGVKDVHQNAPTVKASGVSDRFGPTDIKRHVVAKKAVKTIGGHRRVKSGASDQ